MNIGPTLTRLAAPAVSPRPPTPWWARSAPTWAGAPNRSKKTGDN